MKNILYTVIRQIFDNKITQRIMVAKITENNRIEFTIKGFLGLMGTMLVIFFTFYTFVIVPRFDGNDEKFNQNDKRFEQVDKKFEDQQKTNKELIQTIGNLNTSITVLTTVIENKYNIQGIKKPEIRLPK